MKPTADQIIQEFDGLSIDEKRHVYATITEHSPDLSSSDDVEVLFKNLATLFKIVSRRNVVPSVQIISWKDIPIIFFSNKYIQSPEDIWQLESILGSEEVRNSLRKSQVLDADFVEELFKTSTYTFYINQNATYLFSTYADIDESKGGPLKELTTFDALQRYGLKRLEESKEKLYVRL